MYILCAAPGILCVCLLIKLIVMKRSTREISQKLTEKLNEDTNTQIDISTVDRDMQRLAAELNKQIAMLRAERIRCRQGDNELKTAVTNISHDLRTPLTAISGYLDLLDREETSDTVRGFLTQIRGRTNAMNRLTEELFQYSIAAAQDPKLERVCLNDVLEESAAALYGAITERGITPNINIPEKRVERISDKSALMRIFGNVLGNAVKYSSGDLEVTLDENGTITFANISEHLKNADAERLFDRFYTVETGGSSTGLGLSIAKLLTEKLGGAVTAKIDNCRLTITLSFPK